MNIGVPRILQWSGFTGLDARIFQKGLSHEVRVTEFTQLGPGVQSEIWVMKSP